ncbi:hypothetical protein BDF20DRAFT_805131, partial [Mycotypha africana]|uniref:uncharacterized protein n=1 Tax=Mycotypha africana TaxID=64632 RepID=UPI0023001E2E
MSNPFESNPWQSSNTGGGGSGPIYGNAYDNEPTNGYSSYNNNNTAYNPSATYNSQFSTTGYNNAWGDESNKTQYDHNHAYNQQQPSAYGPAGGDAYQFAGTRYGNQPPAAAASAYSNIPAASPPPDKSTHHAATTATETTTSVGPDPWNGEVYHTPNRYRFWLRFVVLITSIGHLGFAAGAQPV